MTMILNCWQIAILVRQNRFWKRLFFALEDPNPILSFSLNKYDAVVLTSINDLEYARRNLTQNASLQEIPGERYFLACIGR